MAEKIAHLVLLFCLISISNAQEGPFLPSYVVLDVTKDPSTNLYVTKVFMGNQELVPMNLAIDLSASVSWISSDTFSSSSYKHISSCSLECSMAKGASCSKGACVLQAENPISKMVRNGELAESYLFVEVRDVIKTGSLALIPHFLVSSAPALLLDGLGDDVKGILGFGKSRISLLSQVSETFGFKRKFSLCLSSSKGEIFLGESGKSSHLSLMYTPLVYSEKSYQIGVKSMRISGRKLVLEDGFLAGAKISTSVPYSTMERKLYKVFVEGYVRAALAMNMTLVSPRAPFGVCFRAHMGNVPIIDLVLQSEMVKWRILGRNSMVHVSEEVMCLGFLDGGLSPNNPKGSLVLGGYQLEDNVLEFDLATSMLGFSSTLLNVAKKAKFDS